MAHKEIRIKHERLRNPETITQVNENAFKENDLDIHKNEVDELVDDHKRGERIYKVRKVKFFDMGRGRK
jgi:hypothetical protein